MKKILLLLFVLVSFTVFSCLVILTPMDTLYLLNWGEYIDPDLLEEFGKLYNCQVIEETVTSSETMYQKITEKNTPYDVAIPGDYVITQLYNEGLLRKIDVDNIKYPVLNEYQTIFTDSLKDLTNTYMVDSSNKPFDTYYMPYFWGAYSIIYSTQKSDVENVVLNNGFEALYNRSLYNESVKIGMYDTARWVVASYLLAQNKNPNITDYNNNINDDLSSELVNNCKDALLNVNFDEFGNDSLKRNVALGSLDMCYTQLGDFFDVLFLKYDQDNGAENINFNVSVPSNTAAFFDGMVIPTTTKNYDLANKFIEFMLEPTHAYQNANAIGYCPTLKSVCDMYHEDALAGEYYYEGETEAKSLTLTDFLDKYPMYLDPLYNSTNAYLLEPKSANYLLTCEQIYIVVSSIDN